MNPAKTVHVPQTLIDTDALAEPLACILSAATKMSSAITGDRIAVVGTGYISLGILSLFKTMGYGNIERWAKNDRLRLVELQGRHRHRLSRALDHVGTGPEVVNA